MKKALVRKGFPGVLLLILLTLFFSCDNILEFDGKKPGVIDDIIDDDLIDLDEDCIAHEWSELSVINLATETKDGEATRTCAISGEIETITLYATGTPGLNYELINNDTAYRVNNGMNMQGAVNSYETFTDLYIPAYHLNEETGEYLPVIEIGTSVNSGTNNAFGGIYNNRAVYNEFLTSVTFAENRKPTTISNSAFQYCTALTSITIPESVTTIGNNAFSNCTGLESINVSSAIIGQGAFSICKMLTEVTITESVTIIAQNMFQGCASLIEITIPGSVTSIGTNAFNGCTSLIKVILNEGLETISQYAFGGKITDITIPASVTSIGMQSVNGINNITVASGNPIYVVHDGVLYNKEEGKIIAVPASISGHITIPEGITMIIDNVSNPGFKDRKGLTSVTIPSSVTTIGFNAFGGCTGLTSLDIPEGVTTIGPYAFQGSGLVSVNIPGSVTTIDYNAFDGCKSLSNVTLEEGLTSLSMSMFKGCSSLESIIIPSNVKLSSTAFYQATLLTSVTFVGTIPSGLFDANAFYQNGDLRAKFYAEDSVNGTPGTYIATVSGNTKVWTLQE